MVYLLAEQMQLKGFVKNRNDGVHIYFNATEEEGALFLEKIKANIPSSASIISSGLRRTVNRIFTDFRIVVEDTDHRSKRVAMSPDLSMCAACRNDLHDINSRRYRYPFITCTQCGPRYSILNALPYERHNTSMQSFTMCDKCRSEYDTIKDRRFFSQTNSCVDCGIKISIMDRVPSVSAPDPEIVLMQVNGFLKNGKIIAVKGIGGYLLLCDANSPVVIRLLRSRKHRPNKPFAILYKNIGKIQNDFKVSIQEKEQLESPEGPIVLLEPKAEACKNLAINDTAPGLNHIGVMLPTNPLFELIADDYDKPLIATSANISGSPIIYRDEDAIEYLFEIADYIVGYDREIIIPQDDSVVQFSKYSEQRIILRRSRGLAPSFIHYKPKANTCILSLGAFLKSTFTLCINGNVFVSQYLGDGEGYESQQMFKDTLSHWLNLYDAKPDIIIADMHPGYFSHQYAIELAADHGADIKFVQHHEAHFAAALAENNLLRSDEPILGVVWDGTGLGTDGNIWGGEFFTFENNEMIRCYHFDYFPVIAGDKMALEPRISALCASFDAWPQPSGLREKFTDTEWSSYQSLLHTATIYSSSVGRIFDVVASLLGICDRQSYEGEAAMYLQALAEGYINANGFSMDSSYFKEGSHYYRIPTASLIQGIALDISKGKPKSYVAAKFHYSLVCLIDIVAKNLGVHKICFSGGVFQNMLLVDWIKEKYKDKYQLSFHMNLSPNDENISFGQLVYTENGISSALAITPDGKSEETYLDIKEEQVGNSVFIN
jgi:hydrogenase maturation protein HypF